MEKNLTPEQQQELRNQLKETKKELKRLKEQNVAQQANPQDQFIQTLFDKGGEILIDYTKMNSETQKYEIDKASEIEKAELTTINKLDTKEKIYKGILIGICLVALVVIPIYIKESQMIIPVLSLVVGLLFKSNSVTDFISYRRKTKEENYEQ
tara:strand:- start:15881 stop:16339 length:459 start_codon:yes stop_codon:yes gene_type:complete